MNIDEGIVYLLFAAMGFTIGLIFYELKKMAEQEKWFNDFLNKMKKK